MCRNRNGAFPSSVRTSRDGGSRIFENGMSKSFPGISSSSYIFSSLCSSSLRFSNLLCLSPSFKNKRNNLAGKIES